MIEVFPALSCGGDKEMRDLGVASARSVLDHQSWHIEYILIFPFLNLQYMYKQDQISGFKFRRCGSQMKAIRKEKSYYFHMSEKHTLGISQYRLHLPILIVRLTQNSVFL